jgi:hypothetical protein
MSYTRDQNSPQQKYTAPDYSRALRVALAPSFFFLNNESRLPEPNPDPKMPASVSEFSIFRDFEEGEASNG